MAHVKKMSRSFHSRKTDSVNSQARLGLCGLQASLMLILSSAFVFSQNAALTGQ